MPMRRVGSCHLSREESPRGARVGQEVGSRPHHEEATIVKLNSSIRRVGTPVAVAWLSLVACDQAPSSSRQVAADAGVRSDAGALPDAASLDLGARDSGSAPPDGGSAVQDTGAAFPVRLLVRVRLDGEPVEGARASYGGSGRFVETSSRGLAIVELRPRVAGFEQVIIAAHPDARTGFGVVTPDATEPFDIELFRFSSEGNAEYRFQDPGTPTRRGTTAQCAHCHVSMVEDWFTSAHRSSARNRSVTDLYSGAALAWTDEVSCIERGGRWAEGKVPGGGRGFRCYIGSGLLQTINENCQTPSCDSGIELGTCAACHAPGIDGDLVGRGLLEAEGRAYEYGVHCDVCHRVSSVETLAGGPGVSGALQLVRPSEGGGGGLTEDGWLPLTFGPSWDSPNPRMGSVPRGLFRQAELCQGCHQYAQPVLAPGATLDAQRWPMGVLPVQSTYDEWRASPYAPGAPCQGCHMPPDPEAENGADLQLLSPASRGIAGGWPRPPGSVRSHAFVGPRTVGADMLRMAGALRLTVNRQGETLEVEVIVQNVGAGHAIPTGEPARQIFLRVEARCETSTLAPIGGEAIGPIGGLEARQLSGEDWTTWPGAAVGDTLRAVRIAPIEDYDGVGPFSRQGRFSPAEKGRRPRRVAGSSVVVGVDGNRVQLDRPLPAADEVYRVRPGGSGPAALAGLPGTSFARVMVSADGRLNPPHFEAVDILRDDRLKPRGTRTTRHRFRVPSSCTVPEVKAWLIWRPFPRALTLERGWARPDKIMTEVQR